MSVPTGPTIIYLPMDIQSMPQKEKEKKKVFQFHPLLLNVFTNSNYVNELCSESGLDANFDALFLYADTLLLT